jgi:hypothetical protein
MEYPRNRLEFDEFFPDEESCLVYLERLRWRDGFVCPRGDESRMTGMDARALFENLTIGSSS